jgi:putative tryptophan/tyrosine transport system substrate-binding protein
VKRRVLLSSALAFVARPLPLTAQAMQKVTRIGWVTVQQASSLTPYVEAFRSGLADRGYVEGRNLALVLRYGDDHLERVPELIAELVQIPVDLIVAQGAANFLINKLDLPVPVVYGFSGDPVVAGFADSLAKPHANMTGVTFMAPELTAKRLELLREIIPTVSRVAILAYPEHPGEQLELAYSKHAAQQLGISIDYYPTSRVEDLSAALGKMAADPPQAISLFADGFALQNRDRTIGFAMEHRLPVISGWPIFAESGALCCYGPNLRESYRRLAYYADRILKGAKPTDLPVEQPTKFELVVNMKTAKALDLTIPASVLARADEVIE